MKDALQTRLGALLVRGVAVVYFMRAPNKETRGKVQGVASEGLNAIVDLVNKSYRWHAHVNLHLCTTVSVHG